MRDLDRDLQAPRRRGHGVSAAGLAAALILFACTVALAHWVEIRTVHKQQSANPAAVQTPRAPSSESGRAPRPAAQAPVEALTLEPVAEPATAPRRAHRAPNVRSLWHRSVARDPAYRNDVTVETPDSDRCSAAPPVLPAAKSAAAPHTAPASSNPSQPGPRRSAPAKPGASDAAAPATVNIKPPAQNNPAIKTPKSTKPVPAAPDTVVRAPASSDASEPFYTVRLNKADSKYLADVVSDTLKKQGFETRTVPSGDGSFYVKVGDYNFRYAAENAKKQLNDLGFNEAYIEEKTAAR